MALKGMRSVLNFQSMNAPLKPCVKSVGSMSRAQRPSRDNAICYSKKEELAMIHSMHFCPYCLVSVLVYLEHGPLFC